jgi:hypothetical protein
MHTDAGVGRDGYLRLQAGLVEWQTHSDSNPSAERRPSSTLGIGIDGLCVRPRLNAVVDEQQNAISKGVTQIRDRYTLRIQALVG